MQNSQEYYRSQLSLLQTRIQILNAQLRWIAGARFMVFASMPGVLIAAKGAGWAWLAASVLFVFFLMLVKVYANKQESKRKKQLLREFYQRHLKALENWNFTMFPEGTSYQNTQHPYTSDLWVFGKNSLFQMVSRCHPQFGEKPLVQFLSEPVSIAEIIEKRQDAVREMSYKVDFLARFYTMLHFQTVDQSKFDVLHQWISLKIRQRQKSFWRFSAIAQFLVFAGTLTAILLKFLPVSALTLPLVSMVFFLAPSFKQINSLLGKTDKFSTFLNQIRVLAFEVETETFFSDPLKAEQNKLLQDKKASSELIKLVRAFQLLEYRMNVVVGILLNVCCLWDSWCMLRIEHLKTRFHHDFDRWIDGLKCVDMYCSLGRFAFDHENTVYPECCNGQKMDASELGHPFIPASKRVCNSFSISQKGEIMLVTGANMAGKSTFLRTVGITVVMASAGLPVFANSFRYTPVRLFTSMLSADDLSEEKSYFLAEVERLVALVEYRQSHPNTLLIMDEILKGTNSHDKEQGSRLFIARLVEEKATAIIATHDLNLTHLEKTYPGLRNYCFEVDHHTDRMIFDYKLRKGATKNMNALLLMRQKGLIQAEPQVRSH